MKPRIAPHLCVMPHCRPPTLSIRPKMYSVASLAYTKLAELLLFRRDHLVHIATLATKRIWCALNLSFCV